MIYFGATGLAFSGFDGADDTPADADCVDVFQSDDPLVLEQRVNQRGVIQATTAGRVLMGIQLSGTGKGGQFTVQMLTSRNNATISYNNFPQNATASGLNVFFFKGETEHELNVRKQDALARARAFVVGFQGPRWWGCEIAGSNDGRSFMGMLVIGHTTPQPG